LASIALNRFVQFDSQDNAYFDFEQLERVTKIVARNLNKIIDINYYPVPQAKTSNLRHRPIGIGIQVSTSTSPTLSIDERWFLGIGRYFHFDAISF